MSARASVGSSKRLIAVPCFGEEVAPSLDAARHFRLWTIEDEVALDCREVPLEADDHIERVRLLRRLEAEVVICGGVSACLRQMLEASGCQVVDGVVGRATEAVFGYLAGRIRPREAGDAIAPQAGAAADPTDLVEWTRDLLIGAGWRVRRVSDPGFQPVDLTARQTCPVCGKPVLAAVCCAGHTHRVAEEIREFQRVTAGAFHARLYVQHAFAGVQSTCREYGITLVDPAAFADDEAAPAGPLYPLRGGVQGHELVPTNEESP